MMDTYEKDDRKYLPIYDMEGNLLWPKQMSKEEENNK